MMIDEAIAHAREVAEKARKSINSAVTIQGEKTCIACTEEHEQIAEWLEELKTYREKKCNKSVYLANKSIDMIDAVNKGYADGYNKAIDDFVEAILQRLTYAIYQNDVQSITNLINDVAEKLKGE